MSLSPSPSSPEASPKVVVALTTWPADRDPSIFARTLIDERLAACVNVLWGTSADGTDGRGQCRTKPSGRW